MDEGIEQRIKRVQAGEIQEYAYIVQEYQKQLFVYCWRLLGSRQEAEDAVQDVLVKAFEKICMYRPSVSFSSWLYKMAYHHCLNSIRRRKLQRKLSLGLFIKDTAADSAAQVMDRQLFSEPLSKALEQLTVEERNVLVLRIFEEKPFAEIGEIMNKSPEAVKKKYGRTKSKLRKLMDQIEEEAQCVNYQTLSKTKA